MAFLYERALVADPLLHECLKGFEDGDPGWLLAR